MRLLRWANRLGEYNFDVQYKPGNENVMADLLSRSESSGTEAPSMNESLEALSINTVFGGTALECLSLREVATASLDDPDLAAAARKFSTG